MFIRALFATALIGFSPVVAQPVGAPPALTQDQPAPQVERHITDLKKKLAITPGQETQWNAFASAMRQNATHMSQLSAGRRVQTGLAKAPEEMRGYAEVARAHAEDLSRLIPPFDALYATMSPEQQANADRTFNRPPGRAKRG